MKILITGANGLIGSYLYNKYKEMGHVVVGVDNFSNSYKKDNTDILEGDCENLELMNKLCSGVDIIYHCACIAREGFSNFAPVAITKSVFVPSVVVATAAINNNVKRIYNFTSMARYGRLPCPFSEDMIPSGVDPYGVSKIAAENVFNILSEIYNFEIVHICPHNVFGINTRWDDITRGVINIFIVQALKNEPLIIHNDGNQRRSFSFVEDAFSFAEQLLDCKVENKECFNVGPDSDDTYLSINELADFIINEIKSSSIKKHIIKINDVKEAKCSSDKIRNRFGWESKVNVYDEIRKMIVYAKSLKLTPLKNDDRFPVEIDKFCPNNWKKILS